VNGDRESGGVEVVWSSAPLQWPVIMTETLRETVLTRLDKKTDDWAGLVLAALDGREALAALLEPATTPKAGAAPREAATLSSAAAPDPVYLKSITVEGFRGVGPRRTLELNAWPGLTLVIGRNGSGKSSFAEALEVILTESTSRFRRAAIWKEGWGNLHHPVRQVGADFALEGLKGVCSVTRTWAEGAPLEQAETAVQMTGRPKADLDSLGWRRALQTSNPILSYNELGGMMEEGPSKLFDALNRILGLEAITEALAALKEARTAREALQKQANAGREQLAPRMAAAVAAEPRAKKAYEVLSAKEWDLSALDGLLAGATSDGQNETEMQKLARLALIAGPDPTAAAAAARDLREATAMVDATRGTLASKAASLAEILDKALLLHAAHGDGDCPVCGNKKAMDVGWRQRQAKEIEHLRQQARAARDAQEAAKVALAQARRQAPSIAADLVTSAQELGLETAQPALQALLKWLEGLQTDGVLALAEHLETQAAATASAIHALAIEAAAAHKRREDVWRPLATALALWIPAARTAQQAKAAVPMIKKAEGWLKDTEDDIRNDRVRPIAEQAKQHCAKLLLGSNVVLGGITLAGSGVRRRVEMDVRVDGTESAALGVMSQGELNSLALSLFIPRATLADSPFRFIVIDDPVQSMDPARVDGLARVLQATARERQVVVFTHDDRLPEAVRRLGIEATMLEVTRREGSVVDLRAAQDPVGRYIEDARALARTDNLPAPAARRVIPGLCREALEAACMEAVRRRRFGKGESRAAVEELLVARGKKLTPLAALAVFDETERAADVLARINKDVSREAGDAFKACADGTHAEFDGDKLALVHDAERLARWLQRRP
jgi:energy-coupling factor transporter ATP-binding protein EcfA2